MPMCPGNKNERQLEPHAFPKQGFQVGQREMKNVAL